jgi:hypothetical protein
MLGNQKRRGERIVSMGAGLSEAGSQPVRDMWKMEGG